MVGFRRKRGSARFTGSFPSSRQRGAELRLPPLSLSLTQPRGEKTSPSAIAEGRDPCKLEAFLLLHLARVIVN